MIEPTKTLGILGGGQLGFMFTLAARSMGYRVLCYDPNVDCPTGTLTRHIHAPFDDQKALTQFAEECDAITLEFENIPVETLQLLEQTCRVTPSSQALSIAQNRTKEKKHFQQLGLPTTNFVAIEDDKDVADAWQAIQKTSILKVSTLGYDGKGQIEVHNPIDLDAAFSALNQQPCVLEEKVDLDKEVSVILCRNGQGQHCVYPLAENIHHQGILATTIAPARINPNLAEQAIDIAITLAESLQYVGVLAVEFFVTKSQQLLVNEVAPRPHNSGHFTIDACITSQFQQQVKMMCALSPGSTLQHTPAVMKNILGDIWETGTPAWHKLLNQNNVHLHLYSKDEPRVGRKMGHFTCLDVDLIDAIEQAGYLFAHLAPNSRND